VPVNKAAEGGLRRNSLADIWFMTIPAYYVPTVQRLFGNKEMRILMLGLDAAGKTSESCFGTDLSQWICRRIKLIQVS
jgi:hypothetical protein